MKNIYQLYSLRMDILDQISYIKEDETLTSKQLKTKLKSRSNKLNWVKDMILYLESEPSEEFLTKELERLTKRRALIINASSFEWHNLDTRGKNKYMKETGLDVIERHLKNIRFLLF